MGTFICFLKGRDLLQDISTINLGAIEDQSIWTLTIDGSFSIVPLGTTLEIFCQNSFGVISYDSHRLFVESPSLCGNSSIEYSR